MSKTTASDHRPRSLEILAYGAPNALTTLFTVVAVIYLPALYATDRHLSLAAIGTTILAARLFDAFIDPALGNFSDRMASRFGGRKIWLLLSTPVIVTTTFLLFEPSPSAGPFYLLAVLIAWYAAFSAFSIPYYAWGAEVATGYAERGRLIGVRETFALIGFCSVQAFVFYQSLHGRGSTADTLRLFADATLVFLPVTTILAVLIVPRCSPDHVAGGDTVGSLRLANILEALRLNGPYRRIMTSYFLLMFGSNVFGTLLVFYLADILHLRGFTNAFVFLLLAPAAFLAPLAIHLNNRFGKHRMLMIAHFIYVILFVVMMCVPAGGRGYLIAITPFWGFAYATMATAPTAIVSDTADYFAWRTGRWQPGLFLSGFVFLTKFAVATGSSFGLWMVALSGFHVGGNNDHAHIVLFKLIQLGFPALAVGVGGAILFHHPITAARHLALRRRLERRTVAPLRDLDASSAAEAGRL